MAKPRFSSETLYHLRNHIPIDLLIRESLKIPSRTLEGYFRFLCPLCSGYNTATNPDTNLARCFSCNKNFNTIDLVMLIRQLDFIQSVHYLKDYYESLSAKQPTAPSVLNQARSEKEVAKRGDGPIRIDKILDSIVPLATNARRNQRENPGRISKLEKNISELSRRLDQIESLVRSKILSS